MVLKWIKDNVIGGGAHQPPKTGDTQRMALEISSFTRGDYAVAVVGESHYMSALKRAKRSAEDEDGKSVVTAVLLREPDNRFDKNAIKVSVLTDGTLKAVGHLARETALEYRDAVDLWEQKGFFVSCKAALFGGYAEKPNIGVWLDLPDPEEIGAGYAKQFPAQ